jgi:diguanylate cyclase (GGDEF)-like protein
VARRIALFDPARRLGRDLIPVASSAGIDVVEITRGADLAGADVDAILVAPAVATELPPSPDGWPPRWIVGDASSAGKLAGAAASAQAVGVLLAPVTAAGIEIAVALDPGSPEQELARTRGLIAASVMDATPATLAGLAEHFAADDCIVWWRDGETMTPVAARDIGDPAYRQAIATGARIAAAAGGTAILSGTPTRSVIAEALRTGPTEVAGLFAIIADTGRRFSHGERADLRAVAARLVRELQWMAGHRRLVAEGERLLAGSMLDPLTSALTRGAFEQTVTAEVAAASRRGEPLSIGFLDLVGMRRINLEHGHAAGDEVLAQVAATVKATIRGNDRLARFGGDELAVLLVGAAGDQGRIAVEKLIDKVRTTPVVHDGGEIRVEVRGAVTGVGQGERSGEAAFARGLTGLRRAGPGQVVLIAPSEKVEDGGAEAAGLTAGTIVGGTYRVIHELSRGAMGVVYRGEDLGLARPVAIKVLRSDIASDREAVAQFRAEAALLASLHHENLVQVFALGEHAGDVYFVMELVEGQPVSDVLRAHSGRGEKFPAAAVGQIATEIADALDAMHAIGVIHRDVKPANVLLDRDRARAVLVDVGVATRRGQDHEAAGTPGFAAPESFLSASDSPEVDVYGLAATVYAMFTGAPPYGSGNLTQVVARQLNEPLVPLSRHRDDLPPAVDAVIAKALDPQPKKRWAKATTFAVALVRAIQHRPTGDSPPPRSRPSTNPVEAAERVLVPTAVITAQPRTADRAALLAASAPTAAPGSTPPPAHFGAATAVPVAPAVRRTVTGKVRAAHFKVASKVIAQRFGDVTVRTLTAAHPTIAAALAPSHQPLDWLELDPLVHLLWLAEAQAPGEGLPRQIGRATITATFARLFGANPSSLPVATVLRAAPTFWRRYHEWCNLAAVVDATTATFTVDGEPGAAVTCELLAGELARVVELAGGSAVVVEHPSCRTAGAATCRFELRWT